MIKSVAYTRYSHNTEPLRVFCTRSSKPGRQFQSAWLQEFNWLSYDKGKQRENRVCTQGVQEIASKTEFILGMDHFKKGTVQKHGDSKELKNDHMIMIQHVQNLQGAFAAKLKSQVLEEALKAF